MDCTFKDNIWKFPLLEITATTNEKNTFIIAQALVRSESHDCLLWILEQVSSYHMTYRKLNECIFDRGKFTPCVVLTDMSKGFSSALSEMKKRHWPRTRHLWCRWHIYNAIKRKCGDYFKQYPKG